VEHFFRRDVHYVVQEGEVRVVDESTGRIFADRSWRDGLHQAVEAREGLEITSEKRPIARITRQRLFRRYDRLCGMTGTAVDSAGEFAELYGLQAVVVPLWKPSRRSVQPSRCFADADAKWSAVVEEVRRIHETGRPILVGTRTIADSETLAERLAARGVPHLVLNGKQDADEAEIVAQAGRRGAVTIATNMAGRGTDIKLGPGMAALGGLHVIGTQRHSSRRIDRQLVGRSARQGDPGSAQFFLSADDDLLHKHRPWLSRSMQRAGGTNGEISADYDLAIRNTQRLAEKAGRAQRRQLFHSDHQRDTVMAKFAGEEGGEAA
jgi:preprotein translocase subunit SecA